MFLKLFGGSYEPSPQQKSCVSHDQWLDDQRLINDISMALAELNGHAMVNRHVNGHRVFPRLAEVLHHVW